MSTPQIVVPISLKKDPKLENLSIELEIEVQLHCKHQILEPIPPAPATQEIKASPDRPKASPVEADWLEKTLTTPLKVMKPAESQPKPAAPKSGKTKIDNVLNDLLKKTPRR